MAALASSLVKDNNGNLQQAQSSGGLSGANAPVRNQVQGGFTQDGDPSTGIQWKNLGPAPTRSGVVSRYSTPEEVNFILQAKALPITDFLWVPVKTKAAKGGK